MRPYPCIDADAANAAKGPAILGRSPAEAARSAQARADAGPGRSAKKTRGPAIAEAGA